LRKSPEQIQHEFYTATSDRYDEMHVDAGDEHSTALTFISGLIDGFGYRSVLDVGAGTGRGVRHLIDRHPGVQVRGIEPVRAMIDQAERRNGIPAGCIEQGPGGQLPFADNEFDAVCELGVLHHVGDPDSIVREMARVARRAVFLSDENRFGRGRPSARAAKFALRASGLWPFAYRLATRGRSYRLTEGDGGVAYSYSVYDSLAVLQDWADRVFVVPTEPAAAGWMHPMFTAHHVLMCALRDE
jgi:ubiquinone/menaquinone biosynthesis C-methylase UbiE